jgi:GMP synthase-like glutamine amidotransferase
VQDYDVVARPGWMADLPDRFAVHALHQDQVVELPPGATVLAESSHCPYAALAYGDPEAPQALTIQPHPEYGAGFMDELIALRAGSVIPEDMAAAARGDLGRDVHNANWARLIVDYLHRVAGTRAAA